MVDCLRPSATMMTPKTAAKKTPAQPCPRCGGRGTIEDDRVVGARFRRMRKMARVTMRQVGDAMGLTEGHVSYLELGKRTFAPDLQLRYTEALRQLKESAALAPGVGAPSAGFPGGDKL